MVKLSTYRAWKGRHLFDPSLTENIFKGKARIVLPIKTLTVAEPLRFVKYELNILGFTIVDYFKGLAERNGQLVKIGKVLTRAKKFEAKKLFDNDPGRVANNSKALKVVISRHPYDILGCATGRGWKSCLDIQDGSLGYKLYQDVENGNLVAYLVNADDTGVKKPLGRFRIIRYANSNSVIWKRTPLAYGTVIPEFANSIDSFLDKHNSKSDGIFERLVPSHLDCAPRAIIKANTLEHLKAIEDCMDVEIRCKALAELGVLSDKPSTISAALNSNLLTLNQVREALCYVKHYSQLEIFAHSEYRSEIETDLRITMCKFPQYYERFNYIMEKSKYEV